MRIILIAMILIGCSVKVKKPVKKPFIITYKFPDGSRCVGEYCSYEYTDANGNVIQFCEYESKYDIGDTIK